MPYSNYKYIKQLNKKMIIDRTFNRKNQKYTISYLDKNGNRAIWQKYLHHWATYEYDDKGLYDTWNGRKCNKIFKDSTQYLPNEFDQLEFIYQLPKDLLDELGAPRFPRVYFTDIETEIGNGFAYAELAEERVNLISIVGPDLSVLVLGLKDMNDEQKELLRKRYMEYLMTNEFARNLINQKKFQPKVLYQSFHDDEKAMLKHWFIRIVSKVGCLCGWNYWAFDWQYLTNRLIKLFGKYEAMRILKLASPIGELSKISWSDIGGKKHSLPSPAHCMIWDYMELVKKYEFSLRPYESYSLDWVGEHGIGSNKVKYKGSLKDLYLNDWDKFVYYNAIDSALGELIHYRFKCVESPCASASVTLIPAMKALGQVALTTANLFKEFYNDNKHVVYEYDAIDRTKVPYEGAFCGAVPGRHEYCVCDDFASLYPSTVISLNLSPESIVENKVGPDSFGRYTTVPWTNADLDRFRKDPKYFVSVNGTVYKNDKQYAFARLQARQKKLRNTHKYLGWNLDAQLLPELDRLIKIKENIK